MANVGYATLQVIPSVRGIGADLRRQLVGPAGDAGTEAGERAGRGFSDRVKDIVTGITIAEGARAIGQQFVQAFSAAIEQSNVRSTLQAQLGTGNAVAAAQGKIAGKLYSSGVSDTFEGAAEAIKSVVQGGLVPPGATNRQLQSIATKASDVANIFGQDMPAVTNAAAQAIRTGLAKDSTQAFDLITKGFQSGADKAGDFLDTLNEYGTQFRKLGIDGPAAIGLINQGLRAGARDSDIVADAIKEFSIRAVDGSTTTADGFKRLGLSASDMAAQIGKGGSSASAGLDTVLGKLRGIKDPVKQSQIAVELFGTQAEDLGQALFALDPSTATKGLGDFAGAADKAGKTIRSGPSYELTVFKRTLQQGLVDFLGGKVIPVLSKWGGIFLRDVLPPISRVSGILEREFVPTVQGVRGAVSGTVGWFQKWGLWLTPLAVIVGGLTLVLTANAIATGLSTAALWVQVTALTVAETITGGFAAAMGVLNAVMALNPFVLVAIAVVALGAALVVAWKKSETFRDIVMGAWHGIQAAALAVWNGALKPAIDGFMTGLRAVGTAAQWLWGTVLSPVFSFIASAAKILLTAVVTLVLLPIVAAVKLAGVIFGWLWTVAIKPAFDAIAAAAVWLWGTVLQPVWNGVVTGARLMWTGLQIVFGYFMSGLDAVGQAGQWLWRVALQPVWNGIVAGARLMWTGVNIVFGYFKLGLRAVGDVGHWLWTQAVKPAWNGIKSIISAVWTGGIRPVFNTMKDAVRAVGASFNTAKNAIKTAWDKVKSIARGPVQFVVDTVYNRGIVGVWNHVADAFGAPKLSKYKFATGGPVFGAGTETSDDVPAWLSRNEHVWTAREVRGAGGHGAVMALRKWAAAGGNGTTPGFASGGGLFDWIGKAGSALKGWGSAAWDNVKAGAKWLKDTLAASTRAGVNSVVRPLLSQIPGLGSSFGKMVARVPDKAISAMLGYADKADAKGASSLGGKIPTGLHKSIITQALAAAHVPPPGTVAQWLAGMNTLISRESGWNASAVNRWDSNAKAGHPSQGLTQTIPGTWSAYVPSSLRHRGILDPVANVAASIRYIVSRYGNITRVQQANANKPPKGYAAGTLSAAPGWAWVGEHGPELVRLSGGQRVMSNSASMSAVAAQAAAAQAATTARAGARGADLVGQPVRVEVRTRDEALAEFIDVRVYDAQDRLVRTLNAG